MPSNAAQLVCANVETANATLGGLSTGTRLVIALGFILASIVMALPAAAIAVICFQLLAGRPFARTVSRTLIVSAIIVLVAGIGVELATQIGRVLASSEVLPPPGAEATATASWFNLTVPLWPFGAALALGALGAVFRQGAVLQRETEGLV